MDKDLFDACLLNAAIGMARIMPALYVLPFMSEAATQSRLIRITLGFLLSIAFMPFYFDAQIVVSKTFFVIVFKEIVVGFILGFFFGLPFWVAQTFGEIIDNQRGATISSTMDPTMGVTASPLSGFMNYYWAAIFLANGGMLLVCLHLAESYLIIKANALFDLNLNFAFEVGMLIGKVIALGTLLAGPAIASMLLTEMALGLLSRFAPQLNAFSIALGVKSIIAMFILILYFTAVMPNRIDQFGDPILFLGRLII